MSGHVPVVSVTNIGDQPIRVKIEAAGLPPWLSPVEVQIPAGATYSAGSVSNYRPMPREPDRAAADSVNPYAPSWFGAPFAPDNPPTIQLQHVVDWLLYRDEIPVYFPGHTFGDFIPGGRFVRQLRSGRQQYLVVEVNPVRQTITLRPNGAPITEDEPTADEPLHVEARPEPRP